MPMTAAERKRLEALEAWRLQQVAHNRTQESTDAIQAARIDALEDDSHTHDPVEPPPPPPPPPPVDPPPTGIIVPAGTGLIAAINAAPTGSTLILRGGDHVMGSWGASTTYGVTIRKRLSLWAYSGEVPRIHAGSSRPNLIYVGDGGNVDFHGLTFATIVPAIYDDSNGSALSEPYGGGIASYDACRFVFAPNSVSSRQHQVYVAGYNSKASPCIVRNCYFDGGMNDGTGVHCYHDPGTALEVSDSEFRNFDSNAAVILDQTGTAAKVLRNDFFDCHFAAVQFRKGTLELRDNTGTRVAKGVDGMTPTVQSGNVWSTT
jgi:hypothetical protein